MIIETCVVGDLGTNCYIVADEATKEAVVIDPGAETEEILRAVQGRALQVRAIFFTHGHFDHVGGAADLHEATGAPIWCHKEDEQIALKAVTEATCFGCRVKRAPEKVDFYFEEGVPVNVGSMSFRVLHTPGHTPGGVTLVTGKYAFSGDTLFRASIGRSDFEGGNYRNLLNSIKTKLYALDDDTVVYTGHGPKTTIAYEKQNNPFVC